MTLTMFAVQCKYYKMIYSYINGQIFILYSVNLIFIRINYLFILEMCGLAKIQFGLDLQIRPQATINIQPDM